MRRPILSTVASLMLALVTSSLATACLIEAPEKLEEPDQIPPRVLRDRAEPNLFEPAQVPSAPHTFLVEFVSEDLGENVVGRLYLDYTGETSRVLGTRRVPAGRLDDETPRKMDVTWERGLTVDDGCYAVTMTLTHASNYSLETQKPINEDRTAFVTWFVAYGSIPLQDINLDECYSPALPAQ